MYTELEVANEIAKLIRLFEVAARNKPALRAGLSCAVGLSNLWAQKYAPAHPDHPIPDFGIKIDRIMDAAESGKIPLGNPRPVEPNHGGNVYRQKREILNAAE